MAARYSNPVPQYSDINGIPFAGGKLQFFENGTTTDKDVFSDPAGTISLGNEITLDAEGRVADFFGEGTYRVRMLTVASVQIFERDDVIIQSPQSAQLSGFDHATKYSIGDLVQGADGNYYISITNGNIGNNPVTDAVNWSQVTFLTAYNANETYNSGDLAIGSDGNIYKSLTNSNTNNDPLISPLDWNAAVNIDLSTFNDLLPQGYLFGLDKISINVTDPEHDIDFPTGVARDSTDSEDIRVDIGFTKRIDANFLPGDDNGGFPSALSLTADTTYNVFILKDATGAVDGGFDTDINAVNLLADASPLGFTFYRKIGEVTTDSSSNIFSATSILEIEAGANISAAKAWINYNGVTNAIRNSYNVTSVTDNGTGDYTVNFTVAFSSADFSFSGVSNNGGAGGTNITGDQFTLAAGSARFEVIDSSSNANSDSDFVLVQFFGDQ